MKKKFRVVYSPASGLMGHYYSDVLPTLERAIEQKKLLETYTRFLQDHKLAHEFASYSDLEQKVWGEWVNVTHLDKVNK